MRLKILCCEVFAREIAAVRQKSPHEISLQFFSKGLHEIGSALMRQRLQHAIDWTEDSEFEAIALAYGMCGFGTVGLRARDIPLVIPRAHDCITALLGSLHRHEVRVAEHPGTYFRSSGWLERRKNPDDLKALSFAECNSLNAAPSELIRDYGCEAGEYLTGILCQQAHHYDRLAFIETGAEPDDRFECASKTEAKQRGWIFEKLKGDLNLLHKLVAGDWASDDFLFVPPGHEIRPTYDHRLLEAAPVQKSVAL
jgi:hypothetical protein